MFVGAISLSYLSLDAVAVYGVMKESFGNRDKHLGALGFSIYHSQGVGLKALALAGLKELVNEQFAA